MIQPSHDIIEDGGVADTQQDNHQQLDSRRSTKLIACQPAKDDEEVDRDD